MDANTAIKILRTYVRDLTVEIDRLGGSVYGRAGELRERRAEAKAELRRARAAAAKGRK